MWNASWIAFGISRGSWIRIECLTIGIVMPEMSASWKPSVPIRSVRTWPVRNTVGTLSIIGVGDRGDQVGRAGPARGERNTDTAARLGVALRGVAGALLVPALHMADAPVVERVVGREVGAARDPEYVLDALGLEALHDGVDGSHDLTCSFRGRKDKRVYRAGITSSGHSRSRPQRVQTCT